MGQPSPRAIFRASRSTQAEASILGPLAQSHPRALDVGTAGTGRSALLLRNLGFHVTSIDIDANAVLEFASSRPDEILLSAGDLKSLPFAAGTFDVVLVAYHGFDYLTDRTARFEAIRESWRVLSPNGRLIIDSYNPVGLLLSARRWRQLPRHMSRYLLNAQFRRPTLVDATGLELHQAQPQAVVNEVETAAGFALTAVVDETGKRRGMRAARALAGEPYFSFRKRG